MKKQLQKILLPSFARAIILILLMGISEQLLFYKYTLISTVFNIIGGMFFVCVGLWVLISESRRKANPKVIFFKSIGEIFFQLGLMVLAFALILNVGSNTDLQIYVIVVFLGAASLIVGKHYENEYLSNLQIYAT